MPLAPQCLDLGVLDPPTDEEVDVPAVPARVQLRRVPVGLPPDLAVSRSANAATWRMHSARPSTPCSPGIGNVSTHMYRNRFATMYRRVAPTARLVARS